MTFLRPQVWIPALILLGIIIGFQYSAAKLFVRATDATQALSSEVWSESGPNYYDDLKIHADFIELYASDLEARFKQHRILYWYVRILPVAEPWVGLREAKAPLEKQYSSKSEAHAALLQCGRLVESCYEQLRSPLFLSRSYGAEATPCTAGDIAEAKKAIEEFNAELKTIAKKQLL